MAVICYLCAHAATKDKDSMAKIKDVPERAISIIRPCPMAPSGDDDGVIKSVVIPNPPDADKGSARGVATGSAPSPDEGTNPTP